ncbi:MAG: hypothetical protein PHV37_02400 [Candidatus Gastranaerophilales bacterium]|nr:hypothetical protein [Candidatus Gastranaerophilales bacterium]
MKRNLFSIFLILFIACCFASESFAADFVEENLPANEVQSPVKTTKADKKVIKLKAATEKKKKKSKKNQVQTQEEEKSEITLDADHMDYYPDRFEMEALGNAVLTMKKENLVIKANKIVYNHDLNTVKAYDNVQIINGDMVTDGDFVNLNFGQYNGWLTHPVTKNFMVRLSANEGYIYSDRIEEFDGVAKIIKNYDLRFGATSFGSLINPGGMGLGLNSEANAAKDRIPDRGTYKIKAKTIIIDSRDEHNYMTVKNGDLYMKNLRIGSAPNMKFISDKEQQFVETNIPEFGQVSELGMFAGPGIALDLPGTSTLKLVPLLNYCDSELGVGGIARYRNPHNVTEIAYGSAADSFVVRGEQKITKNLRLSYSQNAYNDEWFLGYRMPRWGTQLQYDNIYENKDLGVNFAQRINAGLFVDENKQFRDFEGRARWMTQSWKPIYSYTNQKKDFNFNMNVVAQTALSLYTTGDTVGIARLGPAFQTTYKKWAQSLIYYQSAVAGHSPFLFDEYMYGKSNVVLIESLKINKYLTLGFLSSLALLKDNYENDMLQEARFLVSVGPDYAKVTLGYDAYRQSTMMLFSMMVGTEGSDVKFKKAVLKNPENLNKKNKRHFDIDKKLQKLFPKVDTTKPLAPADNITPVNYGLVTF